jgi:hypothetical protein
MTKEERHERAWQLVDEIAASGACADYIDVQTRAKGRGLDREVDALLAQRQRARRRAGSPLRRGEHVAAQRLRISI